MAYYSKTNMMRENTQKWTHACTNTQIKCPDKEGEQKGKQSLIQLQRLPSFFFFRNIVPFCILKYMDIFERI